MASGNRRKAGIESAFLAWFRRARVMSFAGGESDKNVGRVRRLAVTAEQTYGKNNQI